MRSKVFVFVLKTPFSPPPKVREMRLQVGVQRLLRCVGLLCVSV